MSDLRRLVLDVLKPMDPSIEELARLLADLDGVDGVNISIYEIDRRVENAKITIEGQNLRYDEIVRIIGENGGSVHSIDEVAAGRVLIEDVDTAQD
jgi:hypothetical protein